MNHSIQKIVWTLSLTWKSGLVVTLIGRMKVFNPAFMEAMTDFDDPLMVHFCFFGGASNRTDYSIYKPRGW